MVILNQRDLRWAKVQMMPARVTIGRYGCLLTCLCMLSDWYDCFVLPSQAIGREVKFDTTGNIIWSKLNFPTFKFVQRIRALDTPAIDASLKGPNTAVVLTIDRDSHWVLALRKISSNYYWIADPWTGRKTLLKRTRISGSAHFTRK